MLYLFESFERCFQKLGNAAVTSDIVLQNTAKFFLVHRPDMVFGHLSNYNLPYQFNIHKLAAALIAHLLHLLRLQELRVHEDVDDIQLCDVLNIPLIYKLDKFGGDFYRRVYFWEREADFAGRNHVVQCFGLPKQHEFLELSPECSAVANVVINFGKHFGQGRQMSRRSSVLLCVASPGEILETELA